MKTLTLKINSYTKSRRVVNNNLQKNIFRTILFSFGALAICYVFVLGNTVFNIVERRSLESNARVISNQVGELELQYLTLSNNIDLAFAESKGFKELNIKKFATRKSLGSISFAKNEL
ncbi:MAG: hypothetical protein ABH951_02010 [Patescibacteria group bacterium]